MNRLMGSSVDPQKLSLTIKGILGTVVILLGFLGYQNIFDVDELTGAIISVVEAVLVVISTGTALYGLIRKIINKFKK